MTATATIRTPQGDAELMTKEEVLCRDARSLLLAQSGHSEMSAICRLSGVKRTLLSKRLTQVGNL
jgi:hypothetical protein